MSLTITEIAEAFSRHDFGATFRYMLDDIEWTMIGGNPIRGKADVVSTCEGSSEELADATTTFSKFKVITADDCVVIDSQAEYIDGDGESSHVASCDIYDFVAGNLAAITSYTLETGPQ
jgi:ketosteroid isomerase-like protein